MIEIYLWIHAAGSILFLLWHVYQYNTNRFHEINVVAIVAAVLVWPALVVGMLLWVVVDLIR